MQFCDASESTRSDMALSPGSCWFITITVISCSKLTKYHGLICISRKVSDITHYCVSWRSLCEIAFSQGSSKESDTCTPDSVYQAASFCYTCCLPLLFLYFIDFALPLDVPLASHRVLCISLFYWWQNCSVPWQLGISRKVWQLGRPAKWRCWWRPSPS